jgi:hypothetical protein
MADRKAIPMWARGQQNADAECVVLRSFWACMRRHLAPGDRATVVRVWSRLHMKPFLSVETQIRSSRIISKFEYMIHGVAVLAADEGRTFRLARSTVSSEW